MDANVYADGLRQLADFVEEHPSLFETGLSETFNIFVNSREELAKKAREMGTAEKYEAGSFYYLRRHFGPHHLDLCVEREKICKRVQTGVRTIEKPDPKAVAALPTIKVEEPIFEWECPDSILRLED